MTENTFGTVEMSGELLEAIESVSGDEYNTNFKFSSMLTDGEFHPFLNFTTSSTVESVSYSFAISEDEVHIRKIDADKELWQGVQVDTESPDMDAVDECLNTPVEA